MLVPAPLVCLALCGLDTPLDTRTFPSLVPTRTLSRRVVRLLF